MRIGYARVSTQDQRPELQLDALAGAGCEQVFQEKQSGKDRERPELETCLKVLRKGDTLVVWRLDRLGRSLKDLVEIVHALEERGIGFQSLTESIDTTNAGGKLIFHVFAALAEFERNLVRERTQAGLNAARARGRKGGRPKVLEPAKRQLVVKLYAERKHTIGEICRMMGISKPTLYNYLAEASV